MGSFAELAIASQSFAWETTVESSTVTQGTGLVPKPIHWHTTIATDPVAPAPGALSTKQSPDGGTAGKQLDEYE